MTPHRKNADSPAPHTSGTGGLQAPRHEAIKDASLLRDRKTIILLSWFLLAVLSCCSAVEDEEEPPKHENHPRFLGIFSRPGDKSTEKQVGGSILDHLGNVFSGGSIGVQLEAQPLAPLFKTIEHAKKLIPLPFLPGSSSSGNHGASREDKEPPWEKEEGFKTPNSGDPKFEGIGEYSPDEPNYNSKDYVTEAIEDIIQPRIASRSDRIKRSIDSTIFHVPLEFLSNAKPFEVKFKHENHV